MSTSSDSSPVVNAGQLLEHWQGHRRVTRTTIEAFPEKDLFEYSIGGVRPFATLVMEMIGMAVPSLEGIIARKWVWSPPTAPSTKEGVLAMWDETTEAINRMWPTIPPARFDETDNAFGFFTTPMRDLLLYVIDNEVHHRGQGYVYLRALGIEPPAFYDKS